MFQSARIQLTLWYMLIIGIISVLFSVVVYTRVNRELTTIERFQKLRKQEWESVAPTFERFSPPHFFLSHEPNIAEARSRLIRALILINSSILAFAGVAGYFLAGKTLAPIAAMVDEQKRFIADASHELRTPLTSLRSETEVALRDKNLTVADAQKLLQSNLEDIGSLQMLSDNLIKLAKYQKGNGFVFEKSSLRSLVVAAVRKVSSLAKQKRITIIHDVKDVRVTAERQTLTELFVILLDNAIKYSPREGTVTLISRRTDGSVIVDVNDTGVGIDKKDIPHIFDRFYRGDKSRTKSAISGYGLGLSIAKQIAGRHKGTITVKSRVGQGSTFSIRLPL